MAGAAGPNTAEAGLVFGYDTGNIDTCFYGEPTINEANTDYLRTIQFHNQGGYNNAGTTADAPERGPGWKKIMITDRGTNFRIAQFPYISQNYGITKVYSVEYDFGNTSGYFIYGDGSSGFGVLQDTGTRVSARFTPPSAGSWAEALFLGNNTPASGINDTIYYRNYQVEINTHPTQFTPGTRSATQAMIPFISNSTLDLDFVSFNSNAEMIFDGTNDYLDTGKTAAQLGIYDASYTAECFCYPTVLSSDRTMFGTDQTVFRQGLHLTFRGNVIYMGHYGSDYSAGTVTINNWYHIVFRYNAATNTASIFKNGVLQGSGTIGSFIGTTTIFTGREFGAGNFAGYIPIAKIYNRALTDLEVAQNFQANRYRFGI
jgi:hypothetical protein